VAKKRIETLILDLDGTLIDSRLDIARAANYTLAKLGCPQLPEEQIAGFIGGGVGPLLKKALGNRSEELFERALPIYKQRYWEHCTDYTTLYSGVKEILSYYQDKDIAMATNKLVPMTMKILEHFEIASYFKLVLGPDSVKNRKPHPEAIEKILAQLGNPKETALIVGDSHFDIETGKNAGIMTCGVTYGFGSRQELEDSGADVIIDRLEDLMLYYE
jgi:phosphoglycolate phosphatase